MFSKTGSPHWVIVAGAVLGLARLIGWAFQRNRKRRKKCENPAVLINWPSDRRRVPNRVERTTLKGRLIGPLTLTRVAVSFSVLKMFAEGFSHFRKEISGTELSANIYRFVREF